MIQRVRRWGMERDDIRAILLTSSRARSGAGVDALSDYDLIVYATDPGGLLGDRSWATDLGPVMLQMPPAGLELAWEGPTRLVLYEDGTKIDFTFLPVGELAAAAEDESLPDELDAGFRVLMDKDGRTSGLPLPTGAAYILRRPTPRELAGLVEEFFWEAGYVAKNLWRGELLPAKYSLECVMKLDLLRRALEWRAALDQGWTLRPGILGRGLRRRVDPEVWSELERTYVGAAEEENWEALFRIIRLFRRVAGEIFQRLGFPYPHELDARMVRYLVGIREEGRGDPRS